jgi:plasmid maintenance system antidote protein VapI
LLNAALCSMTATELARMCRLGVARKAVTAATISSLAVGKHRMPSLELAFELERVAGISARAWTRGRAVDLSAGRTSSSKEVEADEGRMSETPRGAA